MVPLIAVCSGSQFCQPCLHNRLENFAKVSQENFWQCVHIRVSCVMPLQIRCIVPPHVGEQFLFKREVNHDKNPSAVVK